MPTALKTLKAAFSPPTAAEPIEDLHDVAQRARDAYLAAVLAPAEGQPLDHTQAGAIAIAAGHSIQDMANHIDVARRRKAAYEAHRARDWEGEIQQSLSDYREAVKAVELANSAMEEAQKACKEAHQRSESLLNLRQSLITSRDRTSNDYRKAMQVTGDIHDWRIFNLF